jgi:hypothetical protein
MTNYRIDIRNLQTVRNYSATQGLTPSYIYRLAREGIMDLVEIDGDKFVDKKKYPSIPKKKVK